MLATGVCDQSDAQNVSQLIEERLAQESQFTSDIPHPATISNAFARSLPQNSTRASDIETRLETPKPSAHGYARAYYEPDATYSDPSLRPLLSPFPRTDSPLTVNAFQTRAKPRPKGKIDFEFGTTMTFPAITENEARLSKQSNFKLASTPLRDSLDVVNSKFIGISTGTPSVFLLNQPKIFEIKVQNYSTQNATNIIVQMQISDNLLLTGFDRQSWVDESRRTVSWKIASLESKTETVIRFRAQSNATGRETQKITAGMGNRFQGKWEIITEVVAQIDDNDPKNAIRKNQLN